MQCERNKPVRSVLLYSVCCLRQQQTALFSALTTSYPYEGILLIADHCLALQHLKQDIKTVERQSCCLQLTLSQKINQSP